MKERNYPNAEEIRANQIDSIFLACAACPYDNQPKVGMVPSTVKDIERAIETLTAREIAELYAWLDEHILTRSMLGCLPTSPPGASTRRLIAP